MKPRMPVTVISVVGGMVRVIGAFHYGRAATGDKQG